jgi:hypothetical protein
LRKILGMSRDEEAARRRLLLDFLGKTIELEKRRIDLSARLRAAVDAGRKRSLEAQLARCVAEIADNDLQGAWLRGDHTAH